MKLSTISLVAAAGAAQAAPKLLSRADGVVGFDISNYQSDVDFQGAYDSGARFVIIKATEGTSYTDPSFDTHYTGAGEAGLYRGGYHYAHPDSSSGSEQALYFIENGGGWSDDGKTLPGMLDIEYDPDPEINDCYGVDPDGIVAWVQEFVDTYNDETGRYPLIYTNNDWWSRCAGDSDAFADTCPLVLASYSSEVGTIPGGWGKQTIWQNSDSYEFGGDSDIFNGDEDGLAKLVSG